MGNISTLALGMNSASSLSNLILATPQKSSSYQPQNPPVQEGDPLQLMQPIAFHYDGEQALSLKSDITDHYVEDNTTIQDQIALHPETITTNGFVGELNNVPPSFLSPANVVVTKLTALGAFVPGLTTTAQTALNTAQQLNTIGKNAIQAGGSAWSSISSGNIKGLLDGPQVQSLQQKYFQRFYYCWQNRVLFTVQSPWGSFSDMAIESLRAIQEGDSTVITDFEVTFKKMRFASTQLGGVVLAANSQGRAAAAAAQLQNLGVSTPPIAGPTQSAAIAAVVV